MDKTLLKDLEKIISTINFTMPYVKDYLTFAQYAEESVESCDRMVALYRSVGNQEEEIEEQTQAIKRRNDAANFYEVLAYYFEADAQVFDRESTTSNSQQMRQNAARLRSMIPRLKVRAAQLRAQGIVTEHEINLHRQKIIDVRTVNSFSIQSNLYSNYRQPTHNTPIVLGTDVQSGMQVHLADAARQYSLYTIGTTGVGKSTLLENIAIQDMENGDGLCFLDPHGDSARSLLARVPAHRLSDALFWDPKDLRHPLHLNPFFCADIANPVAVDQTVENFISALSSLPEFTDVFKQAPQMLDILRHMAFACVLKPGTTLLDSVAFLTDTAFRHTFYGYLLQHKRKHILKYWQWFDDKSQHQQDQITPSSLNKLRRLITTSITATVFSQYQPTLDLRALMDEGKILLVDLSRLGEGNGELLGAFLVFALMQAAFSRGDIPEDQRRPFHLFADEFERFMTTAFPQIIDEGRKFKLFCVLAHQHRAQLDEASQRSTLNIKNKVVFRVNSLDAAELAPGFSTEPPPLEVTGQKAMLTLSNDPWGELVRNGHTNPQIVGLMGQLRDLFYKRNEGVYIIEYPIDFESLLSKNGLTYQTIDDLQRSASHHYLTFPQKLPMEECATELNPYLLAREHGHLEEHWLTVLAKKFTKEDESIQFGTRWETYFDKSYPIVEKIEVLPLHKALRQAAAHVIREILTKLLSELGNFLAQEENHIKTESGQYEPIYGPLRTHNDVAAETANMLTLLPKYTAHCILEEQDDLHNESKLVEYDIRTLAPTPLPTGAQMQAQQLTEQSRNAFDAANATMAQEESALDEHAIMTPRTPAYDDPSYPLPTTGTHQPAAQAGQEDDPFG